MIICAVLVLLMTPGLGLFYGGLGRRKNVVNNIMASMFMIAVGTILWVLVGFSLTFGEDHGGVIGSLEYVMFTGVDVAPGDNAPTIPFVIYAMFQMMFAILTPALLTGAIAGRMNFKALFLFAIGWSLIVYYPIAHMVWGGGFLASIGSIDFAGGNVVHISSGISGLVLCTMLGKRLGYDQVSYRVHNIPMVALGATMLLVGWFGFNAGSACAANGLAAHAFATTAVAAAAAELMWMILDMVTNKKPTLVGACTGIVAGLVAITPGCGYVPLWAALIIGLTASPICYWAISFLKRKLGYDDALDAFGCHGIGGIWGGICTGLFASQAVNPSIMCNGLVFGDVALFGVQIVAILVSIAWAGIGTFIIGKLVNLVVPLRVSERDEKVGLDVTQHGERAYPSFNGLDD
jgi:Amt family ammonium transporter